MTQAEQPIVQLGPLTPEGATARSPLDDHVEEGSILAQARADPARFAPLYERYFARVYHYCLRRVHRPEDAEDLAGLVFIRALAGLREYRGGSFAAWLFRIAHNAAANFSARPAPARFTRAVALVERSVAPDPRVRDRVWQRTLALVQVKVSCSRLDASRHELTIRAERWSSLSSARPSGAPRQTAT